MRSTKPLLNIDSLLCCVCALFPHAIPFRFVRSTYTISVELQIVNPSTVLACLWWTARHTHIGKMMHENAKASKTTKMIWSTDWEHDEWVLYGEKAHTDTYECALPLSPRMTNDNYVKLLKLSAICLIIWRCFRFSLQNFTGKNGELSWNRRQHFRERWECRSSIMLRITF